MALPDVADTYRITMHTEWGAEKFANVFYYRDTTFAVVNVPLLADNFWQHVKATWRALIPAGGPLFMRVEAQALFAPYAFGIYAIPAAEQQGTRAAGGAEWLPAWNAFSILLAVGTRVTRPGHKRIAGMLETDQSGGVIVPAVVTLLQALADRLDVTFNATGAAVPVTPVIVGYPTLLQPPPPRVQDVTQATASPYVSHQVSRDLRP